MIEKHLKLYVTFNVYPIFQHFQIFCINYLKKHWQSENWTTFEI